MSNSSGAKKIPKWDNGAFNDVQKLVNAFTVMDQRREPGDEALLKRLGAITRAKLYTLAEKLSEERPETEHYDAWNKEREKLAEDFWEHWWTNESEERRSIFMKRIKDIALEIPGRVVVLQGAGLMQSPDARLDVYYQQQKVVGNIPANITSTPIAPSLAGVQQSTIVLGSLPYSKKPSLSQFNFVVSTNRRCDGVSPLGLKKAQALKTVFRRCLSECLSEMKNYGLYLFKWLNNSKLGISKMPAPWGTEGVLEFTSSFRDEVGPSTGVMHAHIYVGIRHRMKVQIDTKAFKVALLEKMNALLASGNPSFDFGEPLTNISASRPFAVKKPSLAAGEAAFHEYVTKEDEELRLYLERTSAERRQRFPQAEPTSNNNYENEEARERDDEENAPEPEDVLVSARGNPRGQSLMPRSRIMETLDKGALVGSIFPPPGKRQKRK